YVTPLPGVDRATSSRYPTVAAESAAGDLEPGIGLAVKDRATAARLVAIEGAGGDHHEPTFVGDRAATKLCVVVGEGACGDLWPAHSGVDRAARDCPIVAERAGGDLERAIAEDRAAQIRPVAAEG